MTFKSLLIAARFRGAGGTGQWIAASFLAALLAVGWFLTAAAQERRSIELILDASGSMNGRLADGTVKIKAAKQAVAKLVENLAGESRLAFRAYGHQSPTKARDCKDTQLVVGFGSIDSNRSQVVEQANGMRAQGYTPITYVIGLAADDLKQEAVGKRIIILVSDGKETCEGDPCATARKLKEADASLVIHTIGFAADDATRFQLQCVAAATGGTYFNPGSAGGLVDSLGKAAAASQETTIKISKKKGPGRLKIAAAGLGSHNVIDPETGEKVANISKFKTVVDLPAGIYNVTFGKAVWKSIVVKPEETTVLEAGVLRIKNADSRGHQILDSETGEKIASIDKFVSSATLIPSTFDVTFGKAVWPGVTIKAGETKILKPGVINVTGAKATVLDAAGKTLNKLDMFRSSTSLPPGEYTVRVEGQDVPVKLVKGKIVNIKIE